MTASTTRRRRKGRTEEADRHRELLRMMIRIREFEEACVELYSATRIRGFLHLYSGEEAVAAGVLAHLSDEDAVVSTYREHGHAIARGITMASVMAELFGRTNGCSAGRGGSMHLFDAATRFYGGNAIVGGGLPLAVGLALADRMRGADRVTVCFFGEGAVAEGEFHESMNLASLWRLPVLFCCENNLYAMGTALARSHAATDLALRAASYDVISHAVDGMDALAVDEAARRAVDGIREGGGPHFLELRTYRFRAHSMYDPELYRDKQEVEEWRQRDPIDLLEATMTERGELPEGTRQELEVEARAEVADAVEAAEAGSLEPVETLTRFVYSDDSSGQEATT